MKVLLRKVYRQTPARSGQRVLKRLRCGESAVLRGPPNARGPMRFAVRSIAACCSSRSPQTRWHALPAAHQGSAVPDGHGDGDGVRTRHFHSRARLNPLANAGFADSPLDPRRWLWSSAVASHGPTTRNCPSYLIT
jgi:hypothetical protein